MTKELEQRARAGLEAFNRRDLDEALDGFTRDVVWEVCSDISLDAAVYHGHEGVREFWAQWGELFSEFELEIVECRALDDGRVLAITRARGVGAGSGIDVTSPEFAQVFEFRGEKTARVRLAGSRAVALGES